MSFIKPEVHNVPQCHQRKTKLWTKATCTKKFGEVWKHGFQVMWIDGQMRTDGRTRTDGWTQTDRRGWMWMDRRTDRHTDYNTLQLYQGDIINIA